MSTRRALIARFLPGVVGAWRTGAGPGWSGCGSSSGEAEGRLRWWASRRDGSRTPIRPHGEFPTIGNAAFEARIRRTLPNESAILMVPSGRADLTLGPGICRLFVEVPAIGLNTTTSAGGGAVVPIPNPADPALRGGELFLQAAVFDTGGFPAEVVSPSRARHLMTND